ncbi:RHS repeat-associated core domain-containing protein, partial [Flavobacterium jumunjinense]|nr:RHS repeat-associated core domain-containing protein [Flavobacterium jumunjinense]
MGCLKLHTYTHLHIAHTSNTEHSREKKSDAGRYQYKYNGKELQTELGLNMYDYGARNYDPALGRWMNIDPLAEKTQEVYSYVWNNPIMNIDPDGRSGESTHTDKDGNVLAVFNDGDNSVYKHDTAESKDDVEKLRNEKSNNSGGGTKMGETEHWDEFVSPETGKTMTNYRIQFGKSFDPIIGKLNFESKKMDLKEIALNSRGGGIFDLKKDFKNVGALLEGKYATSRSAGNFLAGLNAEGGRMFGVGVNFETFQKLAGALHIEESNGNKLSSSQMKEIVVKGTYNSSNISNFAAPTWGEVNYQYRMSRAGWFKAENSGVMTLNY